MTTELRDDAAIRATQDFADMVDNTLTERMTTNGDFMQAELGRLSDMAEGQGLYILSSDLEAKAIEASTLYMYLEDMLARVQHITEPINNS